MAFITKWEFLLSYNIVSVYNVLNAANMYSLNISPIFKKNSSVKQHRKTFN